MAQQAAIRAGTADIDPLRVPAGTDLVEWYFDQGWTDGLPVVPPTRARVDKFVAALGGDAGRVECKVPPRHGSLTREVLAVNMVMAGCKPDFAPVVRAAMLALTAKAFNLNGVQATTHMAAPLLIVNGPVAAAIGMNGGCNAFGSGNRANATIGRALRLVLLNVGGGRPGDLDKSTLGHPGKYTYCVAENEAASPWAPYHVEKGFAPDDSTVFVLAAEPPHSVTNHVADDPEGILDSVASAMSTIGVERPLRGDHRTRACPRHRRQRLEPARREELPAHERLQPLFRADLQPALRQDPQPQPAEMVQARAGVAHPGRARPRPYPPLCRRRRGGPLFRLHPRLGHMSAPVLRGIETDASSRTEPICVDGTCYL
jgi:hypothetical protein